MNIFYLDNNIKKCAQSHCDTHVIKMILESAQILCTVLHHTGQHAPYKATHEKHPCTVWAGASLDNWLWLRELGRELNNEYQYRFNHDTPHKSFLVINQLAIPELNSIGITTRPQAMDDKYKVPGNPVQAYRQYYLAKKSHLLKYTKRAKPKWMLQEL